MKIDLTNLPKLIAPAFRPLLMDRSRYEIRHGGAGSGKSVTTAMQIVARCLMNPRHKIVCTRKHATDARKSLFELLQSTLTTFRIEPYCQIEKVPMIITLPNGARIICTGMDDSEKMKSIPDITGWWHEEATEDDPDDFRQSDLRLRGNPDILKKIYLTFNPVHVSNWIYEEFFTNREVIETPDKWRTIAKYGNFQATYHHSTYKDNPFLDGDYRDVLEQMSGNSPMYHRVYAEGLWGQATGTVYYGFDREGNVTTDADYTPGIDIVWAHDFNISAGSPMSSCIGQIKRLADKDGKRRTELHIFDEIIMDTTNTNDTITEMDERLSQLFGNVTPAHRRRVCVYGDAAGKHRDSRSNQTDYTMMSAAGYSSQYVPSHNPPIRDRHNAVNALLKSASGDIRLRIHPRCKTLIQGLETVTLKKGSTHIEEQTRAQHVTTALGYLVSYEFPFDIHRNNTTGTKPKYWK